MPILIVMCGVGGVPQKSPKKSRSFPTGIFLLVVGAVCLGLAVTAVYSFVTLSRLRVDYLSNRCHEIAVAVDAPCARPRRISFEDKLMLMRS